MSCTAASDLTVGLPVYNMEGTVGETLDALLGQTYGDFKLLISDNASTDGTAEIIAGYAARDRRIRVVRQPFNRGAGDNFWYVLMEATTPLFTWFAGDDLCAPTFLERTRAELLSHPDAIICGTDICVIDEFGRPDRIVPGLDTTGLTADRRAHALLRTHGWFATYGVARRERLLGAGRSQDRFGGDVIQTADWILRGDIACVREPLFLFRHRTGGKDAATYQASIAPGTPHAKRPNTEMLAGVVDVFRRSALPAEIICDATATMARTVAFENESLCTALLAEHGLRPGDLDDLARFRFVRHVMKGTA